MNVSKLTAAAAAIALVTAAASTTSARPPVSQSEDENHYVEVIMTGSAIPQQVRIKPIGTATTSPVRIFDRREIDQTGAFTTEDVLRHDPSIKIHGFGQAGPNN